MKKYFDIARKFKDYVCLALETGRTEKLIDFVNKKVIFIEIADNEKQLHFHIGGKEISFITWFIDEINDEMNLFVLIPNRNNQHGTSLNITSCINRKYSDKYLFDILQKNFNFNM